MEEPQVIKEFLDEKFPSADQFLSDLDSVTSNLRSVTDDANLEVSEFNSFLIHANTQFGSL